MKKLLPIILIVLALVGAITYSLAHRSVRKEPTESIGIAANQLEGDSTITPTPTKGKKVTFGNITATPTPSVTPTVIPEVTEKTATKSSASTATAKTTTTTKTTICTPVYGSADTCTEHIVVDTGTENAIFFNLAILAYLGGLISFIKAKSIAR